MPQAKFDIWQLGAQFMANVQARNQAAARRQLIQMIDLIAVDTDHNFSHLKLRTLQLLTNANRAAFAVGAPNRPLTVHSRRLVAVIDGMTDPAKLTPFACRSLTKTISLVPRADAYRDRKVEEATAYIRSHFHEPLNRGALASLLQCSPAHFSRFFAKAAGCSFKEFLLQVRLDKAKELLRTSLLPVNEIAQAAGYEDPFQFSKAFRRKVGMSPREFRKTGAKPLPRARAIRSQGIAPNAMSIAAAN